MDEKSFLKSSRCQLKCLLSGDFGYNKKHTITILEVLASPIPYVLICSQCLITRMECIEEMLKHYFLILRFNWRKMVQSNLNSKNIQIFREPDPPFRRSLNFSPKKWMKSEEMVKQRKKIWKHEFNQIEKSLVELHLDVSLRS